MRSEELASECREGLLRDGSCKVDVAKIEAANQDEKLLISGVAQQWKGGGHDLLDRPGCVSLLGHELEVSTRNITTLEANGVSAASKRFAPLARLCEKHIQPLLGVRKLKDLRAVEVETWLSQLATSLSTRTLQDGRACLNRSVSGQWLEIGSNGTSLS